MYQKAVLETINLLNDIRDENDFDEADQLLDGKLSELISIWKD